MNQDTSKFLAPSHSLIIKTEVVCPNDTNPLGILQGGRMIDWMDKAAAIVAQTHSGLICVTVGIYEAEFYKPACLGDIVTVRAFITRCFRRSMEILAEAYVRNVREPEDRLAASSIMNFVIHPDSHPEIRLQPIYPETVKEQELYDAALQRREKRLQIPTYQNQ